MKNKFLIYQDQGCADNAQLVKSLRCYDAESDIVIVSADDILKRNVLNKDVKVFFMPGGASTPYRHRLEVLGNTKIRQYVQEGGVYCGICAGAYYACEYTDFERNFPELSVQEKYGLDLVQGAAVGTLYQELGIAPYSQSDHSAAAVSITWLSDCQSHVVYYHGGPYFKLKACPDTQVLAVYDVNLMLPAIISRTFGRGKVILSGVHFEDDGFSLQKMFQSMSNSSGIGEQLSQKLQKNEQSRQALLLKLMTKMLEK